MKGKTNPRRIIEKLQEGIALHNAGQLADAETCYRSALKDSPRHPDALHLLALICHARRLYADAARYSELAIAASPSVANFYNTAGEARRMLGDIAHAVAHLEKAIQLDSQLGLAHHNLSLSYFALSRLTDARRECATALSLRPDYPEALAHGLHMAGLADDQVECLRIAQSLRRIDSSEARNTLAHFHLERAKLRLAEFDWNGAETEAGAALQLAPDHWGSHELLAIISHQRGQPVEAEESYRRALDLAPDTPEARLNLAHFLVEQRQLDEAESLYDKALDHTPGEPAALFGLAGIHLLRGDYQTGWRYYESRWDIPAAKGALWQVAPPWNGDAVASLLLYCEQGYGDTIQMLRFLPEVVKRARGRIALHVPVALERLVRRNLQQGQIRILSGPNLEEEFAAECPLMSLPGLIGIHSPAAASMTAPYLTHNADRCRVIAASLDRYPGRKLGIVWQGGAAGAVNSRRALPPETLEPIVKLSGWVPVSLQFGVDSPRIAGVSLLDLSAMITDFDDLAAAIMAVDIVVSVDSAPAHLAAALGKETLVLLPSLHDWRWGRKGDQTPWYPSMTLARQEVSGSWSKSIQQVIARLQTRNQQCNINALTDAAPAQPASATQQKSDRNWWSRLRHPR